MSNWLNWPVELADASVPHSRWQQPGSNLCLDFHGDPRAPLVVFSDGNHHMALQETLARFRSLHPALDGIFYATTPPGVLLDAVERGGLQLGNLLLPAQPHLFISPAPILERLKAAGRMSSHQPFSQSRGVVLLFRHGNPRGICSARDLMRDDVRLFLSNPEHETASYRVYRDALRDYAARHGLGFEFLDRPEPAEAGARLVYGERIHHREAPQAIAADRADVAVVYYHLALRYTRVFPEQFAFLSLGGAAAPDEPAAEASITRFHAGIMGDGGAWGRSLLDFIMSRTTTEIYERHGLSRIH